jgi:hypothetical protein
LLLNLSRPQLAAGLRQGASQPGLGVAGSYNVSASFEGTLAGGTTLAADRSFLADRRGRPYQYQVRKGCFLVI